MTDTITSDDTHVGGETRRILSSACEEVGLDPRGARLIKYTNNAVWELAADPVIVRIAGLSVAERVRKVVDVARWLAHHDMPSVRLVAELPQPLTIAGRPVTFWHKVTGPAAAPAPTGFDLGRILRRFHELPAPEFRLPQWDQIGGIRRRIEEQDVLTHSDANFLTQRCDEITAELQLIEPFLPPGPIHGDGFVGNLISGSTGPVICDFDSVALGPREWDLTPAAVGTLRFDYPTDSHAQLVTTYGADVTTWPHFRILRDLRELQLVTSVLRTLPENPSLMPQWRRRFTSFRDQNRTIRWTTYS